MAGPITLTQDGLECSAAPVQTPDTLHIDLPPADPEDVYLAFSRFLMQITSE